MTSYHYTAVNNSGRLVKGHIQAVAESDLERELATQGLFLVSAAASRSRWKPWNIRRGRASPKILIEFYHRLAQAIDIGIPIVSSLQEIGRSLPSLMFKSIASEIQLSLERGNSLQEAMGRYPKVFKPLDVAMVGMGERTGVLPKCLKDLAAYHEWKEGLQALFKKALLYPTFILFAISAVLGVWVGYVLPQMVGVLAELGVSLPGVTLLLLDAGRFTKLNWPFMAAVLVAAASVFLLFRGTPSGAIVVDRSLLRLPVIGSVALNVCLTRLCQNFAIMLDAGMNINYIFTTVADRTLGNRFIEKKLQEAHQEVERGDSISEALEKTGVFPSLLIGALRNGETTGKIDDAFRRMGQYFDKEVQRAVQVLVNSIEPVAILSLGGLFGLIVLSILLPLYDVLGQAGKAY
jgi:type IV pilus assembly protein PilC